MTFSPKTLASKPLAAWAALTTVVLALVGACGGGTSQYEAFAPQRVLAFGDDASAMTNDGRKYSINGISSETSAIDCSAEPLWIQSVASLYGFVFAPCNPQAVAEPQGRLLARPGAQVADLSAQIDAQVAAGGVRDSDLALVMMGMNDVLALYRQYPGRSEEALLEDARNRGRALALQVNRLVGLGAKVIVSNLPEMGLSPYAQAEKAAHTDIDRAALFERLGGAFNEQLGVNLILDGRYVGLVQLDLRTRQAGRWPADLGLTSATAAACTVALPDCRTDTLVANAEAQRYLWADDTRLAPAGHTMMAQLAIDRAQRNPF